MSGIVGGAGSKSGLIGIETGHACCAYLTTTQTNESGTRYLTPWAFLFNDNTGLYLIDTFGIKITVSGTYMVNMSGFTENRSESAYCHATFTHSQTTVPTWGSSGESFYHLGDSGTGVENHERMTQATSRPLTLTAGLTYGIQLQQNSGTRNISGSGLNSLGLTLLKIG